MIYIYDKGKVNEATPLPELFQTLRARSEEMCDYIMDVDNYAMPVSIFVYQLSGFRVDEHRGIAHYSQHYLGCHAATSPVDRPEPS
jgi:hypothetical protein